MLTVTIEPPRPEPTRVTIAQMPAGSVGRRMSDGIYFYRTTHTAACLNYPGKSYTEADQRNSIELDLVELLPPGTRIVLTVQ